LDRLCQQSCIGCPLIHLDVVNMYTLAYRDGFISNGIVGSRAIARSTHWAIYENTLQLHCRDHDNTAGYQLPANKSFCPSRRRSGWSGIGCRPIHSSTRIPYLVLSYERDEVLSSHIQLSLAMQEASSSEQATRRPDSELHRHNRWRPSLGDLTRQPEHCKMGPYVEGDGRQTH
jgi:hypothetical protein